MALELDAGEVREFMGDVRARLKGLENSNVRQGERAGKIEDRLAALEGRPGNGWRTKAVYAGGGGLGLAGLIEIVRQLLTGG